MEGMIASWMCLTKRIQPVYTEFMPKKALFVEEKFYRKAKFWRTIIAMLFLLSFIVAFWDEIRLLFAPYWPIDGGAPAEASDLAIAKLAYNFIGLVAMFFIWVLITSQFVLPVRSGERWLVFQRLLRYFGGFHGPAVFIEKGVSIADEGEMHNTRPGVAFVDLCSAIVLEQQWEHIETGKDIFTQLRKTHAYKMTIKAFRGGTKKVVDELWRLVGQQPPVEPLARVEGPGIVFTRMQEKIRGIADLRQQSRKIEARVTTRDGFEIQVPVGVKFSIGEKPEILLVTYAGEGSDGQVIASPDTIRIIKLNVARNKIKGIVEELDAADRLEIHK